MASQDVSPAALEVRGMEKSFSGVKALQGVSFAVSAGEVHALCGENGAGKSTLIKVLSGVYPAGSYTGEMRVGGTPVAFAGVADSERAGIGVIHQELSLVKELSIAENIYLGREPQRFGVVNRTAMLLGATELLRVVGLDAAPDTAVGALGIGQQQLVEIAKALSRKPRVLLLDEPTAALSEVEAERLLEVVRQLAAGGVACVLISHKLDEVLAVSHRITVLRDGRSVASYPADANGPSVDRIVADMVGRELAASSHRPADPSGAPGSYALEVSRLGLAPAVRGGRSPLTFANFRVRAGEIVGIAGLMGSGRSELLLALFGAYGDRVEGEIRVGGKVLRGRSPRAAIAADMAFLSEDRKRLGLILDDTVRENIALAALDRVANASVIDADAERGMCARFVKSLRIKTRDLETPIRTLSGGNQQKALLARCLSTRPKVLLLDEPTRGVDVGAKHEIYELIRELAAAGVAVVMASSELPEILALSHRVVVMSRGRTVAELDQAEATQESIMNWAAGERRPQGAGDGSEYRA
jgi:D-xylose transport system ATP-binding protein